MRRLTSKSKDTESESVNGSSAGAAAGTPKPKQSRKSQGRRSAAPEREPEPKSEPEETSEEEEYEVEEILDSRFVRGKQQFKIRWKGYGPDQDTWELEGNVDCPLLIDAFLKNKAKEENPVNVKSPKRKGATLKEKTKRIKTDDTDDGDSPGKEDSKEWEVRKIIDFVELKNGKRQFQVRWKGYGPKDDTWEPEENLNCPELIQKFLADHKAREDIQHDFRENRRTVDKYNPDLVKRKSRRKASQKRITYHEME